MVPQRAEEEAREEPFVGEPLGPRGEVVLQEGGIFLRQGGEGRVAMEILDRVAVVDEGEIIAFVRLHLLVSEGAIGLSRLSSPSAGVLQAAELLGTSGEGLKNPHAVERRSGFRESGIMLEGAGEVAERLGRDRLGEVGHASPKSLEGNQPALRFPPTSRGLPKRGRASRT